MTIKVKEIRIEEFKTIEDFTLQTNLNNIILVGPNETGKTTIMQFVNIALGNNRVIPVDTTGAGHVVIDKDGTEYRLELKIEDGKSKIRIRSESLKDDTKAALHALVGAVNFDPNRFVELSKTKEGQKKQVEEYKLLLPQELQEGLVRFQNNIKANYDDRTELNKELTKLKVAVESHVLIGFAHGEGSPELVAIATKTTDIKEVMKKRDDAVAHNTRLAAAQEKLKGLGEVATTQDKDIKELEEKLAHLRDMRLITKEAIEKGEQFVKANPEQPTGVFDTEISTAQETNDKAASAKKLLEDIEKLKLMEIESGELTAKIDAEREAVANAIRDNQIIQGLVFDDDKLTLDGIPVTSDHMSTSQRGKLGMALKYAENPDAPVLIQSLESYDKDSRAFIFEFAQERGLQVIAEKVGENAEELIVEIVGYDQKPTA
jgi:predicted ATP-dependent endonuclease of OLD family